MEERNYIPPSALNLPQNFPPVIIHPSQSPHFIIGDATIAFHQRHLQHLLVENERLTETHALLSQELAALKLVLRHLSDAAVKVTAERDTLVREVYDRAVKMEAEVRLVNESNAELAKMLCDLRKLRSEKKNLREKLNNLRDDVAKVSDEWNQIPVVKSEIETMQKEIQRGRAGIEHEVRVHASNSKQHQTMENYKVLMTDEIRKLQVEVTDAGKRARAAAAAESASIPGSFSSLHLHSCFILIFNTI